MQYKNTLSLALCVVCSLFVMSCSDDDNPPPGAPEIPIVQTPPPAALPKYQANIRRTDFNVVHITANDFAGIGFGQGYAGAQDGICVLADQIIKVRSERARYFGAGPGNVHLASDIGYKALNMTATAAQQFELLSATSQELIKGYAEGYNQYLDDTALSDLPAACAEAEWITPISHLDLFAYHLDIATAVGARNFIPFMAAATPPGSGEKPIKAPDLSTLPNFSNMNLGSNGLVLGSDKTENGAGMLLANPHLPWFGEFTYTEQHLMLPGQLNISGVQLLGVPMLGIGFSDTSAQTVTVSGAIQFTAYLLQLAQGTPTSYLYDGEIRSISANEVSIEILQEDGSLQPYQHTVYASHYGPIISIPGLLEWNPESVISLRFPENLAASLDSYLLTMTAQNNNEFKSLIAETGGSPFLNYLRVTAEGETYFIDAAPVPNLSEEAIQSYFTGLAANPIADVLLNQLGMVLLDGSNSLFEWQESADANQPGTVPFAQAPQYTGTDYAVHNNESPWLVNLDNPIEGFSPLYGGQFTPRQPRHRMGLTLVQETPGDDQRFDKSELQNVQFGNRGKVAELIKDDLASHCLLDPSFALDGKVIDLTEACTLLANWDGQFNLDSIGVPVFREFIHQYPAEQIAGGSGLFAVPFDPSDPVNTPNTLLIPEVPRSEDTLLRNLAIAVQRLSHIDIPMHAPLARWQFTDRSGEKVPLHGGSGPHEGVWNLVTYNELPNTSLVHRDTPSEFVNPVTALRTDGYVINLGPTYVMTVEYTEDGPVAEAVLVYGQSRDPQSSHYSDQMPLFTNKTLRPVLFNADDVAAHTTSNIDISKDE